MALCATDPFHGSGMVSSLSAVHTMKCEETVEVRAGWMMNVCATAAGGKLPFLFLLI